MSPINPSQSAHHIIATRPVSFTLTQVRWSLAAALVTLLLVPIALRVHPGLNAEYFSTLASNATPVVTGIDDELSTQQIERRWPDLAPAEFRVRWFGYIALPADGTYTFSLTADDGAALAIDGATLIDTGAGRGTFTKSAQAQFTGGLHAVAVEYRQSGGDYAFDWSWARGDGVLSPVPAWRLAPRRGDWPRQAFAHALRIAGVTAAFVLLLGWAMAARVSLVRAARRRPAAALLVFFVGMAVLQTWPLASDPGHLSRNDNADTVLNEWALAWVAHQAVTDPLHLFDANIFYPEHDTLAYSESMIVQSAMAAPLLWLGASPVLAYNVVLIAGFAFNGWVMALIMRRWTGDAVAALASGILFAYNSNILTRLPHMQALHVEFLPLALFAWDRLLEMPRIRYAVMLGAMVALQSMTSIYLLVFTVTTMTAAALARAGEWLGTRFRRIALLVTIAAGVAALISVPFLLPYVWVHQAQGFERSVDDAASMSATLGSYLASPSRLHYGLWSYRWFDSPSALFPGVTALILAAASFMRLTAVRDRRARMCLIVGISGVLLSLGPKVPGYTVLFTLVPIVRVVRVVSSFGYIALMGLAMMAAYGVVELRRILPARVWPIGAGAVLLLVTVEPLAAPLELSPFSGVPRIYDRLRSEPAAVVIELPFYTTSAGFAQARYMLNSTRHWRPMLNGYSGYRPPSFYDTADAVQPFPAASSIQWLRQRGVTHVFVHLDAYDEGMAARLAAIPALREVASERAVTLYRLTEMR
jgi:hypothetical protein